MKKKLIISGKTENEIMEQIISNVGIESKLFISSIHDGAQIGILGKLLSYSRASNLLYIFYPFDDILYTILFSLAVLVTALILFTVFMNRRIDLGA